MTKLQPNPLPHLARALEIARKRPDKYLDDLFSEFIRKRAILRAGGCERCQTPKYDIQKDNGETFEAYKTLQCAHFYGRGRKATRYDPDNGFGFCGACHIYFTAHPAEFVEWFIQQKGQQVYDMLQARTRTPARYLDKAGIELYLKEEIKKLE